MKLSQPWFLPCKKNNAFVGIFSVLFVSVSAFRGFSLDYRFWTCEPIPEVEQIEFCRANFVLEVNITKVSWYDDETDYKFAVNKVYKGDAENIPSLLVGPSDGLLWMSCFHHDEAELTRWFRLKVNTTYVISAGLNNQLGDPILIMTYAKNIARITDMDIERWTTKFDCNCKINYDLEALRGQPSNGLPNATADECNAPNDLCPRSGFCNKNTEGVCTWGNHGKCNY